MKIFKKSLENANIQDFFPGAIRNLDINTETEINIASPSFIDLKYNSIVPLSTLITVKKYSKYKLYLLRRHIKMSKLKVFCDVYYENIADLNSMRNTYNNTVKYFESKGARVDKESVWNYPDSKFERFSFSEDFEEENKNLFPFSVPFYKLDLLLKDKIILIEQYSSTDSAENDQFSINKDKIAVAERRHLEFILGKCNFCFKKFSHEIGSENGNELVSLGTFYRQKTELVCTPLLILGEHSEYFETLLMPIEPSCPFLVCKIFKKEMQNHAKILNSRILVEFQKNISTDFVCNFFCDCSKGKLENFYKKIKIGNQNQTFLDKKFLEESYFQEVNFIRSIGDTGDINKLEESYFIEYGIEREIPDHYVSFKGYAEPFLEINTNKENEISDIDNKIYKMNEMNKNTGNSRNEKALDLKSLLTFTIDPVSCSDIDDAASIEIFPFSELENIQKNLKNEETTKKLNENENLRDFLEKNQNKEKNILFLYVHIADICEFIPKDSPLDFIAMRRSTSIYTSTRTSMIPEAFSGDLCSLIPGKERSAVSVIFKILEAGNNFYFIDVDFAESVIKSDMKMSYEASEEILNNEYVCSNTNCIFMEHLEEEAENKEYFTNYCPNCVKQYSEININTNKNTNKNRNKQIKQDLFEMKDLKFRIQKLMKFTKFLRDQRKKRGSLDLNKSAVASVFDSHNLIEELMVLANVSVAVKSYIDVPNECLLRYHEKNDFEKEILENSVKILENLGINLKLEGDLNLPDFLNAISGLNSNLKSGIVAQITRGMSQARYCSARNLEKSAPKALKIKSTQKNLEEIFSKNFTEKSEIEEEYKGYRHYGLGTNMYTHFTSPIRRYSDLMVHRVLKKIVNKSTEKIFSNSIFNSICQNLNEKSRLAKIVQRESEIFRKKDLFKQKFKGFCLEKFERRGFKSGYTIYIPGDEDLEGIILGEELVIGEIYDFEIEDIYNNSFITILGKFSLKLAQ